MPTLDRDGVKLFYEDAGSGDQPFVFVHGWCCDRSYFAPQAEHFAKTHRVISVDLRGHGESDKPEQAYTVAGFADDVAWLCSEVGLAPVVAVGHSLGGAVVLELGARHPAAVEAVVMVDPAPIIKMPEMEATLPGMVEALRGPDHVAVIAGLIEGMLFLPSDDAAVRARVLAEMTAVPQHVAAAVMEGVAAWDGPAALRSCRVPVLDILAANPLGGIGQLRSLSDRLVIGQTVGAGHFNQLLVPDQVNAMIQRFLLTYVS